MKNHNHCPILLRISFVLTLFLTAGFAGAQSPGGVSGGLRLWLKANDATLNAATDGSTVTTWTDQSGNSYNLTQATAGNQPVFYKTTTANLVNFNPSLVFASASNQYLQNVSASSVLGSSPTAFHYIVAAKSTAANLAATFYSLFGAGQNSRTPSLELQKDGNAPSSFNPWVDAGTNAGENSSTSSSTANNPTMYDGGGVYQYTTTNIPGSLTTNLNNQQPQILALGYTSGGTNVMNCWADGYAWPSNQAPSVSAMSSATFKVGVGFGGTSNTWQGPINEVIVYNVQLSSTAMQQVNSYLAIKYGVTLGQGNNTGTTASGTWNVGLNAAGISYLYSDGSSAMWTAAANAGYNYDIAGIVRDDNSGLYQKQSQSVNVNSFVTLGLGSIAVSNTANAGMLSADKSGLVWAASSNSVPTLTQNTAYSINTDGFNSLLNKRWKVQVTGTGFTGATIRVAVAASNGIITLANGKLIVSSNGLFNHTSEIQYALTSTGGYYYADVPASVLTNGVYFTFGDQSILPGGIATNLAGWFKADAGTNATIGGSPAIDGGNAVQWLNQVTGGVSVNNNNGLGLVTAPIYYNSTASHLMNYNPSVYFNGSNSYGLYATTNMLGGSATGFHFIVVARDKGTSSTQRAPMGNGSSGNNPAFDIQKDGSSFNGWNFWTDCNGEWNGGNATMYNGGGTGLNTLTLPGGFISQLNNQQPQIFGLSVTGADGGCDAILDSWVDGYKITTSVAATGSTTKSMTVTNSGLNGAQFFIGSSSDGPWTGEVSEVIAFRDKLTDAQMQQINSYLAVKYGVTLGQGNNATGDYRVGENRAQYNYLASDGTKVWDATALNAQRWHIAGIGRDDNQGLAQKQSTSVNYNANGQVSIGLGTISATGNLGNTNTFKNDRSYLMWGDNGVTTTLQAASSTFSFNGSSANIRMNRVWAMSGTNFLQQVQVSIPTSALGTVSLGSCQKLCLVIASDAAFTNVLSATILTTSGSNYIAQTKFPAGVSYFTFARVDQLASGTAYLPLAATPDAAIDNCTNNGWQYYYSDVAKTRKLFAINANGNTLPPYGTGASQLSGRIDYQSSPYVVTDGTNTTEIMGRTLTIVDNTAGTYAANGGMKVRFYLDSAELNAAIPTGAISKEWFKHGSTLAATLADQHPGYLSYALFYPTVGTGSEDGVDYVEYSGIQSFSTFGFASNAGPGAIPLPVTIFNFTAAVVNSTAVRLTWQVGVEDGVSAYEIQRSNDGVSFATIGTAPATGASSYSYNDAAALSGVDYYRLKTVEKNGIPEFSSVRVVHFGIAADKLLLYPNPATSLVTIQSNNTSICKISIMTLDGKTLYSRTGAFGYTTTIDLSVFATGTYFVKVFGMNGYQSTQKIVVVR